MMGLKLIHDSKKAPGVLAPLGAVWHRLLNALKSQYDQTGRCLKFDELFYHVLISDSLAID